MMDEEKSPITAKVSFKKKVTDLQCSYTEGEKDAAPVEEGR